MKRLLLFILLLLQIKAMATHIVGGEMTYTHLSGNWYEIKLFLYIDCENGNPGAIAQDQYANLALFEGDSGKQLNTLCNSVLRGAPVRVSKTNYNCIKISPDACVDAYEYVTTMELPPIKGGYYISFQRCCRNNTILNLISPLSTGENIWTRINDTTGIGYNSSPSFRNLPPNFLCTNAPLVFDHSATDADGDSLVYEFFHPYTGATTNNPRPECLQYQSPPFSQVAFESGYSPGNAIPSSPAVSLNGKTGILNLTPTLQGQFVVGILVKEYRKGVLIGHTRRDYQFNVQNCVFETTSAFVTPSVNCNREVFFTNNSQNADSYLWNFGDTGTLADTSVAKTGYYRYPAAGTYLVTLKAANGNCVDSIKKTVTVFDRINFKLPDDLFLCQNQTLSLRPDTFYQKARYLWSNGSADSSIQVNGSGLYWLNVKLGNCDTYDSILISLDNEQVNLYADSLRCNPQSNEASATLRVGGSFQTINWWSDPDVIPAGHTDSVLQIRKQGKFAVSGLKTNKCPYSDTVEVGGGNFDRQLKTPNVFTPNSDGINDAFPDVKPPYNYRLHIFNRWGIEIFSGDNSPWQAAGFATGTYYYFIEMEACGSEKQVHGVVRVIR